MLTAYPKSLSPEAITVFLSAVQGKEPTNEVIHAGWDVLGFGLSQLFPCEHVAPRTDDGFPMMMAMGAAKAKGGRVLNKQELCDSLEGTITYGAAPAGSVDWASIVLTVLPILLKWLDKRFGE